MASSELSARDGGCTSQLKIILLGGRNSGKSSLGNLILGQEVFITKERTSCCRRLGVVAGRWLTLVDTPGWWCDFSCQDSSELVKREIISSVSLCSPGPHAFLITIKASSGFSEKRRRAVEEHMALLGDRVWSHCLLVFMSADTAAEELVQRGGPALHWLSDKCGRRCHSVISSGDAEATELLQKIQKLVAGNENRMFEMQGNLLQAAVEEKSRAEERAQQRLVRMRRERLPSRPITDIRIVLVGARGSGKTSTLNTILSRDGSQPVRRTARCQAGTGVVFGRQLTVVDTPGWWMNYFSDESPVFDRRELVLSASLCPPGPHVFLLVIRVDRAFSETYRRAAQEHLQLLGEHIWSRVIVLFSFGDWLGDTTVELCIESEGEPLRRLIERCNNRYHVLNNKTKGNGFQVRELIRKIEEMLSGCKGGQHCVIEREVMEHLERKRRREEERAKERLMRKEKQRQMARSQLGKLLSLPALTLVLAGGRKAGKSSCGDTILSREGLLTETQARISGRMVTVLDTPGCSSVTSDTLMETSAVLLVVNVSSSFTNSHMEAVETQLEVGGGQMWSRAVVLFSHGDWLGDTSIEERIESEGEPLQRLIDKCGNRYHVLDNKWRGDGAQVSELIELIEETLLAARHRDHHMWERVSSQDLELCQNSLKITSGRHQLPYRLTESADQTPVKCPHAGGQAVALPAERTGLSFLSCLASMLSGKETLRRYSLPVRFPADLHLILNGEHHFFSSTRPTMLLVLPQTRRRMSVEESGISVRSLCHPVLRERTLRRLSDSGGLQALIDQWDDSSLEELEAFIDSYFELIWKQTMESHEEAVSLNAGQEAAAEEEATQQNVLSSINRKLSKLELLEEIQRDLAELRTSLHKSWEVIQEVRGKSEQDDDEI